MIIEKIAEFLAKIFGIHKGGAGMTRGKAKRPKILDIDVVVTKLTPPFPDEWPQGYRFELEQNGKKLGKKLDFANKKHPGFLIFFNLVDPDNTGCRFLPKPEDAMWVEDSSLPEPPCPRSEVHWDQFRAVDVVKNDQDEEDRGLIVSNRNDYKRMFAFTLRFQIPGCADVVEFDPVGNNQNGFD